MSRTDLSAKRSELGLRGDVARAAQRARGRPRPGARSPAGVAALALALLVAACDAAPNANSPTGQFLRGTSQTPTSLDPNDFRAPVPCPRVQLLPETETLRVTRGGSDLEPGVLVYQARIDDTARECNRTESGIAVRVGVRGRALSGPQGAPGTVTLPVRVAVREGGTITYSKLHQVSVTLTDGAPSVPFAFVDGEIRVTDESARILVGFDAGARR